MRLAALPRAVVFDVGNVLLSWDPQSILREHVAAPADQLRYRREIFDHLDWVDLDRGTLEETAAVANFVKRTGATQELLERLVHASKVSLTPMPESLALLQELDDLGLKLYVLSNMSHGTWDFLEPRHDFWKRFDGILISAHVKLVKPQREIYEHLLKTWSLDPKTTVFMDDRPENVEGARKAGIPSFVFTNAADARERLFDGMWAK